MNKNKALWHKRAKLSGLNAVLDPSPKTALKNSYLDYCQKQIIRRKMKVPRGTLLDFGCGIGRMSKWLSRDLGFKVSCFDPDKGMLSRAMEEFPEGAQFSTDISDFEGSSETIFSSWTLQHIINNNELKITFMKLLTLSDAKNIFLYEKTSDQAHNDKDAEGVVYQRIRSVSEYLDIFEELGFTKKSIYSIAIRQYGPFRKIFDNPETRIRFVPFWFLFKIDVIISKLKLFIRNGLIYEQDSAILFIKNDY